MHPDGHPVQNFQNMEEMDPEYWDMPDLIDSDDEDEPPNRMVFRGIIFIEIDPVPINTGSIKELTGSEEIYWR